MSDTAAAAADTISEGNGEEMTSSSSSEQQPPATATEEAAPAPAAEIDLFSNLNVANNTPPLVVASEEVKVGGAAKEASTIPDDDHPTTPAVATGDESPGEKKMEDDPIITISTPADVPPPNNNGHDDILLNFGVSNNNNNGETETASDHINQEMAAPSNDLDLLGFGVGQSTTATETPVALPTNTPINDDVFGNGPQLIDQPMDTVVETTSSTMDSGFDFLGMSSPPPPVENSDNNVNVFEQETNETSFEPRATEAETVGGDGFPNDKDGEEKPADVNNNEEGTAQLESEIANPGQALVDDEIVVPSADTNPQINENGDGIAEDHLQETNETKIDAEGGDNKSDKNEVDSQATNETSGEPNNIADTVPIGNEDQPVEDIKTNQEEPTDVDVNNNANDEVNVPSENETTIEATPHQSSEEEVEEEKGELIQSQLNQAENSKRIVEDAQEESGPIDNTETTDQNGGEKEEEIEDLIQPKQHAVNAEIPSQQHAEDVANDANVDVVSEATIVSLPQTNTSPTAEEPVNDANVSDYGNGDVVDRAQEEDEWRSMHSASDSDCPDATANVISEPTIVSLPDQATSNPNIEEISTNVGGNGASESVIGVAVERTQEEEEWLSMGLGLGDALRQIVALTEERESALVMCQEKDAGKTQVESVLVEVQSRLGAEMNQRAEYESQVRKMRETLQAYEAQLATYQTMEDDLEKAQASLVTVVSEKSKIELEVQKLREIRDESQQKEVVLSNRLNDAKKKEANKSTAAGRLEVNNEQLREDLQTVKEELETTSKAKAKLESNMEKLKAKAVERVKQAETALAEERELNEERKKKMKFFVETKSDELREAKDSSNDMQKELEETRASLRSSRDREEAYHKELDAAKLKYRELQRDMERMKRSSEQLHKMGKTYKDDLEQSASETEEHKKKRAAAKHEIMQMVRTLEVEQAVSSKLKEGIKFTFTPKALSQQELLNECLREFEIELERLAAKMGKTLLPTPESTQHSSGVPADSTEAPMNGVARKSKKSRAAKADMDTERLITNLEQETQQVSKGIMALAGSVERMRSLLGDENMFGCMTYLSNILAGPGEAKHHQLGDADAQEEHATSAQFV